MQPDSMGTMKTLPFSFSAKENTSRAEAMSKGLVRRHIRIPTFMERTLRFRGTALVPFLFGYVKSPTGIESTLRPVISAIRMAFAACPVNLRE